MSYIYRADVWCGGCGEAIRARLTAEGKAPADPDNEWSYDSDDFPKRASDDGESDCPQHCADGEGCANAIELPSGGKVGVLLGELTRAGVAYVQEAIEEAATGSCVWCKEVADLWQDHYTAKGYTFQRV
jgi:hypothetical protein